MSSELGLNIGAGFFQTGKGAVGGEHGTSSRVEVGRSLAWLRNGQGLALRGGQAMSLERQAGPAAMRRLGAPAAWQA